MELKIISILYYQIKHQFYKVRRSLHWGLAIFNTILFILIYSFNGILMFFAGLYVNEIAKKINPDTNIVMVINRHIFYPLVLLYVFRFFFEKRSQLYDKVYFLLPIKKRVILFVALLKLFINRYNFLLFSFIIPFWGKNILMSFSGIFAYLWLLGFIMIVFCFELILQLFRLAISQSIRLTLALLGGVVIIFGYFNFPQLWHAPKIFILDQFLSGDYVLFIFFAVLVCLLFYVTFQLSLKYLYLDQSIKPFSVPGLSHISISLNRKFPLISMQILLVLRNKLLRTYLFQGFLGTLFGFIWSYVIHKPQNLALFFAVFFAFFSLGYLYIVAYGQNIFGWEAHYLPALFTRNVKFEKYIKAKYLYLILSWLIFYLINILLIHFLNKLFVLIILSIGVYLMGILSWALIAQAIFTFRPIYPNISAWQAQNYLTIRKFVLVMAAFSPVLILYLFNGDRLTMSDRFIQSLAVIMIIGIIGLLGYKPISIKLLAIFRKRKYSFIEMNEENHGNKS